MIYVNSPVVFRRTKSTNRTMKMLQIGDNLSQIFHLNATQNANQIGMAWSKIEVKRTTNSLFTT